jgi:hypothetical protein
MNCCFIDTLAKCETEIQVYAMLEPESWYRWVITDKFDNRYEGEMLTDANGFFIIPVTDLPAGLLTQYSGSFKLQVFQLYAACNPEKFKVAGVFDCIEFTITGGTFEKNNLGCDFDCNAVSQQSTLIPFTNDAEVTIDWSLYSADYGNTPTISVYHEVSAGVYQLVAVVIEQTRVDGVLTEININNGGLETGYIIISS